MAIKKFISSSRTHHLVDGGILIKVILDKNTDGDTIFYDVTIELSGDGINRKKTESNVISGKIVSLVSETIKFKKLPHYNKYEITVNFDINNLDLIDSYVNKG